MRNATGNHALISNKQGKTTQVTQVQPLIDQCHTKTEFHQFKQHNQKGKRSC